MTGGVGVKFRGGLVHVSDTKLGADSPTVVYPPRDWATLVECVRRGWLPVDVTRLLPEGTHIWRRGGVRLSFDAAEWAAFVVACRRCDFDLDRLVANAAEAS
jgi:hypothetical protein